MVSILDDARHRELAGRLEEVRGRIAAACRAADRAEDEVALVVVSKFFGADDVARLVDLGVRDLGENREQEATAKWERWPALLAAEGRAVPADVRLHFVGQLQSKKDGHVARVARVVQSVDRAKIVDRLAAAAQREGRVLGVCVQADLREGLGVAVDPEEDVRGGVGRGDLLALADRVAQAEGLELRGVMTVAPRSVDPAEAFGLLARWHEELLAAHPGATWRSAGMSGDLEQAVAAGATHVRVGSAILGSRPALG
ncbi:hypothetical protein SAMN05445756_0374 [Kytococcus aerolatus]|uniref:Alanine racemase N-terminal domain-containing protein n=1 Tax=Kytococcus aerolatus TaxID=592308 RepID=A0A212T4F6_9MICO|nr:YggS family pyridoxal phosphate-dependent enzyme [Kytococcus aerolatus]SNC60905.1 hypothetical protein SAMN05445756_0374 [Kytococcus aerolatus]